MRCIEPQTAAAVLLRPTNRLWGIGLGAQSTFGGKTFLPEKYVRKINKMPEFYMSLAWEITKIPEFLWYLPEKSTQFPNFTRFLSEMPEFYIIMIARKIFCPILRGWMARAPPRLLRIKKCFGTCNNSWFSSRYFSQTELHVTILPMPCCDFWCKRSSFFEFKVYGHTLYGRELDWTAMTAKWQHSNITSVRQGRSQDFKIALSFVHFPYLFS